MWYLDKNFYIYTLPSGCCTVRELMGYKKDDIWTYAIVQYKDGNRSLVVEWSEGIVKPRPE